jgi:hypothetical protein
MRPLTRKLIAALTLTEMCISSFLTIGLGAVVYSAIRSGSNLSAKNMSLVRTHEALRSSLDRLQYQVQMSRNVPTLLTTTGATQATGPAAGMRYDRIVGEPYVLDPVATAGSIVSTATTMVVYRSISGVGSAPVPTVSDILLLDTPSGAIRARITAVDAATPVGTTQKVTLTFASAVGKSLTWLANQPQWAKLIRQEAFIVMPVGTTNELRFYPSFDPVPVLTTPANYTVLTNQIGTGTGEGTPFNVLDVNGDKLIQANLRVKSTDFNRWLSNQEGNEMNTYFRMDFNLASRLRPKTTN